MDGAGWLLDALAAEGVDILFGNPGSTELPLTDALGRDGRVRYVLGLHETVVMGMADGYAQQSGRLAAVNVHVQPGLANALAGILNAARARVPVLVTVGQQVQELLPGEPFLGGDLVALARPLAKGAWEARSPGELADLTARAVRTALTHPRGPVVLSVPLDVQVAAAPPPHARVAVPPPPPPDATALDRAAALLAAARAPAVLAGDGVAHAKAGSALAAVAERLGAPVHSEPHAAVVSVPTDHRLWRGPLPPFAADIRRILAGRDVVLAVGMPVFRLFGWSPGPALPEDAALVHLDVDPHEVGKSYPPAVGLVGDVAAGLEGLAARLGPAPDEAVARGRRETARTAELRRAARARLAAAACGPGVTPAALCRAIAAAVGPRDLVVDEALTAGRGLRIALGRRVPGTWLAHRGSALGWGLPAAVGAKLADPSRRVVCVHGDGSFLFGVAALWTAAREGLGVALIVADNQGYEILRAGLEGLTGRPEGAWPGLALTEPALDHTALARGFGASAERVEGAADLPAALGDLWRRAAVGPALLVVRVRGRTPPVGYPLPGGPGPDAGAAARPAAGRD
jgi:benzoylformate decarboxylase